MAHYSQYILQQQIECYETGDRKIICERCIEGKVPAGIYPLHDPAVPYFLGRELLCTDQQYGLTNF